ncbi:hypothetical protein Bccel_1722 [Pseudobacteroides cellulosolvens ATCC 35603 = DSM 2933]|uniref:Uncharacterized protein n=1 Tax=Pseudobacteroides cellulosolvens ATCC 35603 = DSM 2933 TaxID=398512 RepID=A0A0L6JL33_9FIRM|nr:hypothetical protein Bccel_1722 [Pseudobacteroides cellulosolvens ATCC 35603 = DSM 2933]
MQIRLAGYLKKSIESEVFKLYSLSIYFYCYSAISNKSVSYSKGN